MLRRLLVTPLLAETMTRSRALSVLLLAISAACSDEPASPGASGPVPGCYELALGPWRGGPPEAPGLPPTVRLIDSLGTDLLEQGKLLVRPVDSAAAATFPYWAWWEQPDADSLHVVFTTGYVGVELHLAAWSGWTGWWRGRADAFTDVQPSIQATTGVWLQPIACPSP
jgi:hypothetical protein